MFRMYILSLGTLLRVIWWISTNVSDVHTVSWTWQRVIRWTSTNVMDVHTVFWVYGCELYKLLTVCQTSVSVP